MWVAGLAFTLLVVGMSLYIVLLWIIFQPVAFAGMRFVLFCASFASLELF